MGEAALTLLPAPEKANRPRIYSTTLGWVKQTRAARANNDCVKERRLHKEVRAAARRDRTEWLDQLLSEGDWSQICRLQKPRRFKCSRLRGPDGELVESDRWADTMADYLEQVQWRVRPAGRVSGTPLGPELPVVVSDFTAEEVQNVLTNLRSKRAAGPDEIPAEFWKAVAQQGDGLAWLVELVNRCFLNG